MHKRIYVQNYFIVIYIRNRRSLPIRLSHPVSLKQRIVEKMVNRKDAHLEERTPGILILLLCILVRIQAELFSL
jgi:hypothetical protein